MNGSLSSDQLKTLCPNRAWPLAVANQVMTSCGIGLCDSALCNFVRGAEAWSYDTVLVNWTLAAAGDPLVIAPPPGQAIAEYDLFSSGGVGEAILGGWGQNKGLEYTDLLTGGVPVDRGFMMVVCGASARTMLPFQQGADGRGVQSAASPQEYSYWLDPTDDGPQYSTKLQALTLDLTSLRLKLGDTGCIYYLGYSSLFTSNPGPRAGGHLVSNGNNTIPGSYLPFMTCFAIGSLNDIKRAVIQLFVGQAAQIDSAPAGLGTQFPQGEQGDLASGTVYVPYQLTLYGYTVIFDTATAYGGALSGDEAALARQLIAQAQAAGQLPSR